MKPLNLGVVFTARKENEHRVPIHPDHFDEIPEALRPRLYFERGYGAPFGVPDSELDRRFGGVRAHEQIVGDSDIVLLPKPLSEDLGRMREGAVHWGWPHCVQQQELTQVAIDRRLTLLAFEAMFTWKDDQRDMHLFCRNNEMAGYCGVIHALGLSGMDGNYGPPLKATVISFGSVSRGAVYALKGRGVTDITIYSQRPPWAVHDRVLGCRYGQMQRAGDRIEVIEPDGLRRPMIDSLAESDLIVNGILQDTDRPLMFLRKGEEQRLKRGALIIDISCDEMMGFPFARPTSFDEPAFVVGPVTYYAVDHTPSYSWRAASWEISQVVISFLGKVMAGSEGWASDKTLSRSIEIRDGVVQNDRLLSFQRRAAEYPHRIA